MTGVRKSVSQNDLESRRPHTSIQRRKPALERSFSNNDLLRPRSSLRREHSNTHLINGFYKVIHNIKKSELINFISRSPAMTRLNNFTIMDHSIKTQTNLHLKVMSTGFSNLIRLLSLMVKFSQ